MSGVWITYNEHVCNDFGGCYHCNTSYGGNHSGDCPAAHTLTVESLKKAFTEMLQAGVKPETILWSYSVAKAKLPEETPNE